MQADGSRVYNVKDKQFRLTRATLSHLKSFNMNPIFQNNEHYDKVFVNALLVSFIHVHKLKVFELDHLAIQLIRGKDTVEK